MSAGGTAVVFPAPGGATTTALPARPRTSTISGRSGSIGSRADGIAADAGGETERPPFSADPFIPHTARRTLRARRADGILEYMVRTTSQFSRFARMGAFFFVSAGTLAACGSDEPEPRMPPPAAAPSPGTAAPEPPPAMGAAADPGDTAGDPVVATGDRASALGGVYTPEQATVGERVFNDECGLCHASAEFSGRVFQLTWAGRPVAAFYSHISNSMPLEAPGSLPADEYAAVVAYVLKLNGYPAGDEPLPPDVAALTAIQMDRIPD
jgi:mono/diheme cytochrome c family protein